MNNTNFAQVQENTIFIPKMKMVEKDHFKLEKMDFLKINFLLLSSKNQTTISRAFFA